MDELLNAIEKEKNNRFQKLWTKLDKGTKLNRLTIFIQEQAIENQLNEDETKNFMHMLQRVIDP